MPLHVDPKGQWQTVGRGSRICLVLLIKTAWIFSFSLWSKNRELKAEICTI